jgi:hypothetical protein
VTGREVKPSADRSILSKGSRAANVKRLRESGPGTTPKRRVEPVRSRG